MDGLIPVKIAEGKGRIPYGLRHLGGIGDSSEYGLRVFIKKENGTVEPTGLNLSEANIVRLSDYSCLAEKNIVVVKDIYNYSIITCGSDDYGFPCKENCDFDSLKVVKTQKLISLTDGVYLYNISELMLKVPVLDVAPQIKLQTKESFRRNSLGGYVIRIGDLDSAYGFWYEGIFTGGKLALNAKINNFTRAFSSRK